MISLLKKARFLFLKSFFFLLYHPFAWAYDLVSGFVSLGRWNGWIGQVIPFLEGDRILELGYGPGHLQVELSRQNFTVFGIDESRQMGRIALQRIVHTGYTPRIGRALAQSLPFQKARFTTVVATFPSEYIIDRDSLGEINRVLTLEGRLLVLASAWITGKSFFDRALSLLFRVTGQVPGESDLAHVLEPFEKAGFRAHIEWINLSTSRLMLIVANKKPGTS